MNTDRLISKLSQNLEPVTPLPSPKRRFFAWLGLSVTTITLGLAYEGIRPDIEQALMKPLFVFELVLAATLAIFSGLGAFTLAVPGAEKGRLTRWLPLAPFVLWVATLVGRSLYELRTDGAISFRIEEAYFCLDCFGMILLLGLIPGIALFAMTRKAAPLRLGWTGALSAVATASISAIGLYLHCGANGAIHSLLGHFLPVFLLGLVGYFSGKKLLDPS